MVQDNGLPLCVRCKTPVDPCNEKVRVATKSPPAFYCPVCNSKATVAARLCGKWPIEEFKELSLAEQEDFWKSCGTTAWDIMKAIEKHLVRRIINQRVNALEGDFLPLSVWAKKGFDPAIIEAQCEKEMHPQLGATYQVKVHHTGERAIEEHVREHMAKLILNPPAAMRPPKAVVDKESASGAAETACDTDETKKEETKKEKRRNARGAAAAASAAVATAVAAARARSRATRSRPVRRTRRRRPRKPKRKRRKR